MELKDYKRIWWAIAFLWIMLSLVMITSCSKNAELAPDNAKKLIADCIADSYGTVPVGEFVFNVDSKEKYESLKKSCEELKKAGLIDYTVLQQSTDLQFHVRTWLTDKGKGYRYIFSEDDKQILGFVIGKRTLRDSVKIEGDAAWFSYDFETNELGKALDFQEGKYKGRAKIVFDSSVNKFVFKGFQSSPWNKEKWANSTWVYEKEGVKVFTLGIK